MNIKVYIMQISLRVPVFAVMTDPLYSSYREADFSRLNFGVPSRNQASVG